MLIHLQSWPFSFSLSLSLLVLIILFVLLCHFLIGPYISFKLYTLRISRHVLVYPFVPLLGKYFLQQTQAATDYLSLRKKTVFLTNQKQVLVSNLLTKNLVIFYGPKYLEDYHRKMSGNFVMLKKYKVLFDLMFGQGLVSLQGRQHAQRRKLLSKIFNFNFINSKIPEIFEIVKTALDGLQRLPDLNQRMTEISSKVIITCFLGSQFYNQKVQGKSLAKVSAELFNLSFRAMEDPLYTVLGIIPTKLKSNGRIYRSIIRQLVEKVIKQGNEKTLIGILDRSLESVSLQKKIDLISNQFNTFFFAGSDTSSNVMTSCLYFIAMFPQHAGKLYHQVKQFRFQDLNLNSGKQFEFLNNFIRESHRLHGPTYGTFIRQAIKDVHVQDIFIPKGTITLTRMDFNCYNQNYFQNPFEFNPGRWQSLKVDQFLMLPFSSGHKNCIGQHLAQLQIRLVLIYVLQRYELSLQEKERERKLMQGGLISLIEPICMNFKSR